MRVSPRVQYHRRQIIGSHGRCIGKPRSCGKGGRPTRRSRQKPVSVWRRVVGASRVCGASRGVWRLHGVRSEGEVQCALFSFNTTKATRLSISRRYGDPNTGPSPLRCGAVRIGPKHKEGESKCPGCRPGRRRRSGSQRPWWARTGAGTRHPWHIRREHKS